MKILTYNQNLNSFASLLGYTSRWMIMHGENAAIISTVIHTNFGYGEDDISFILLQLLLNDSKALLT